MALRLDDLKSTKKNSVPVNLAVPAFSEEVYQEVNREIVSEVQRPPAAPTMLDSQTQKLRPWQNLEDRFEGPRTFAAKEAVARAKMRVERNELQARELRQGHTPREVEGRLQSSLAEREKFFAFSEKKADLDESKIRNNSPFVNFFRDLLRQ